MVNVFTYMNFEQQNFEIGIGIRKIADHRFRFQNDISATNCIFVFHAIISKNLTRGEKFYCCFIDYQEAFYLVNRGFLRHKLIRLGCSITMIKA